MEGANQDDDLPRTSQMHAATPRLGSHHRKGLISLYRRDKRGKPAAALFPPTISSRCASFIISFGTFNLGKSWPVIAPRGSMRLGPVRSLQVSRLMRSLFAIRPPAVEL